MQKEKLLSKLIKYKGNRLGIEGLEIDFGNGNNGEFERMFFTDRKDRVDFTKTNIMIVPVLDKSTILLIKQYSAGSEEQEFVFPKGGMNSDSIEESLISELSEETSYSSNSFTKIGVVRALPSYVQLETEIYMATGLQAIENVRGDELENTTVHEFSIQEIESMIMDNIIRDARTICAFHFFQNSYKKTVESV
jgi:ADP-ribose diphosphatase